MDIKPKHQGGYTAEHTNYCERVLVTLLRGLGPWKTSVYLVGGLVPRYLINAKPEKPEPHVGTTDVDLVLDFEVLAEIEAYQTLEQNLKAMGFSRETNEQGKPQNFRWKRSISENITIIVDLLCDVEAVQGGRVAPLPTQGNISAIQIPGARLVLEDYVEYPIKAERLDDGGIAEEIVRVAGIAAFVVLKAIAFDERAEEKDAYDLVYCMTNYVDGPAMVARKFAELAGKTKQLERLRMALSAIAKRFASDKETEGNRKDGPVSYARFIVDPGRQAEIVLHRRNAEAAVELFLRELQQLRPDLFT